MKRVNVVRAGHWTVRAQVEGLGGGEAEGGLIGYYIEPKKTTTLQRNKKSKFVGARSVFLV